MWQYLPTERFFKNIPYTLMKVLKLWFIKQEANLKILLAHIIANITELDGASGFYID